MSEVDDRSAAHYDLGFEAGLAAGRKEFFDSRPDTYAHMQMVRSLMLLSAQEITRRGEEHDLSKLSEIERAAYDAMPNKLKSLSYGSEHYFAALNDPLISAGLKHHYYANDHHPEHHEYGVYDMNLFMLIEMVCDWIAAGRRMSDGGDIMKSIAINADRFGYDSNFALMLEHTAEVILEMEAQYA